MLIGRNAARSICPTSLTNLKVFNQCKICHPDRSVAQWRDLRFLFTVRRGRSNLLHVVFDSFDRVAKDLLQAHGSRTVGLSEVFVDLIPVIHPWTGKAD
jgi:hypothetical protein